jgi:NodT family efflux transporter outer membrane factor (OMF) lipoprotein
MKIRLTVLFLLAALAGCRVGKDYKRPDLALPERFRNGPAADSVRLPNLRDFFRNEGLVTLIDSALRQNNNLKIAAANTEIARTTLKRVRLGYFPELTAQLTANRNISSRNSLAGIGNEQFIGSRSVDDFTTSLGFSWEIDLWGRIRKEKEEAVSRLFEAGEVRKAVQTRLVADLATGYYTLLMLDEQRAIAESSLILADSTLRITEVQFRVGDTHALAVQQARAQLEQTRQLVPQIEQSILQQENALSLLAGQYAERIRRQPATPDDLAPVGAYPVSALSVRPDVLSAEWSLRAANARTGVTQAQMYPMLTISASGGLNSFRTSNWFTVPGSIFGLVSGSLAQPVFQRRQLKTQYEQALLEREKAVYQFRQTVLEGYTQVSDALAVAEKTREQYQLALNRENALREGLVSAGVLFRTGSANYLEVISAQSNYLQARLQASQLRRDLSVARVELYRAMGGGWK